MDRVERPKRVDSVFAGPATELRKREGQKATSLTSKNIKDEPDDMMERKYKEWFGLGKWGSFLGELPRQAGRPGETGWEGRGGQWPGVGVEVRSVFPA